MNEPRFQACPPSASHARWPALFLAVLWLCAVGFRQESPAQSERILELERRHVLLKEAQGALDRKQELRRQGLISESELEAARTALELAELDYRHSLAAMMVVRPRVSVVRALKRSFSDGRKVVVLTIQVFLPAPSAPLVASALEAQPEGPGAIDDIFISLKHTGAPGALDEATTRGTTIALPYEFRLAKPKDGDRRQIEFQLLRDVSSVTVSISGRDRVQDIDVQLEKAETDVPLTLSASQVSQEADWGGQLSYDLRLERAGVETQTFQLRVLNLPRQVSWSFFVPGEEARVSQVGFPPGVTEQRLGLRLFLPDRGDDDIRVDQPLHFWVVGLGEADRDSFPESRSYSDAEVLSGRAGRVRLEVIPRGVGRLDIVAPTLFLKTHPGEAAVANLTVRNFGTRSLDNVQIHQEAPLNWKAEVTPNLIRELDLQKEENLSLKVTIPADAPQGDYEVRVRAEGRASGHSLPAEVKIFRVSVVARPNLSATLALVAGVLALVAGLLFFGLRLTRR